VAKALDGEGSSTDEFQSSLDAETTVVKKRCSKRMKRMFSKVLSNMLIENKDSAANGGENGTGFKSDGSEVSGSSSESDADVETKELGKHKAAVDLNKENIPVDTKVEKPVIRFPNCLSDIQKADDVKRELFREAVKVKENLMSFVDEVTDEEYQKKFYIPEECKGMNTY
jgi:hypothetical protein